MTEISALWQRIESGLERLGDSRQLRPPASGEAIAAAQARLGVTFPPELRESLLRHDGLRPDAWPDFYPMPLADMVRISEEHQAVLHLAQPLLPAADGGDGLFLAVGTQPGHPLYAFEGVLEDEPYYPSWAAFLANMADGLEAGRYVLGEEASAGYRVLAEVAQ